jgi:DNA-binding NtrC family response regulator
MINENAFWREVMDQLPHLTMVFRIDEFDQAHLIFVNPRVHSQLGYTPKEFVIESESEGTLKDTIKNMVSEIARRSHDIDKITPKPVTFLDRSGREHDFFYDFSLFQTKQSRTPMLAVSLRTAQDGTSTAQNIHNKAHQAVGQDGPELRPVKAVELQEPMFIAQSQVMKSVLSRFNALLDQKANILLRGEKGVGKGTFLQKAIQKLTDRGVTVKNLRSHASTLNDLFSAPSGTAIVLQDIDSLTTEQQDVLKQLIRERNQASLSTQWLATSIQNLENEAETGKFDLDLFYQLGFNSLLIPPLVHRKDDLEEIISTYLAKTAHVLNIPLPRIPASLVNEVFTYGLKDNFNDLYRLLAEGLIGSAGSEEYQLPVYFKGNTTSAAKQGSDIQQIKPFDQTVKEYLKLVLKQTDGKIYGKNGAAKALKLAPTTLQSKLIKYGIK